MCQVLFIAKKSSTSNAIFELISSNENIQLVANWIEEDSSIDLDLNSSQVCVLNLSDWEGGCTRIIKNLTEKLDNEIPLLVIDIYEDEQLIDRIIDLGASAYIQQESLPQGIVPLIQKLAEQNQIN